MLNVFAITLFVGSTLVFLIQPMFARMVLPLLGGSPSVWNTCMLFFQMALLAGYAYAHVLPAWLGARRQSVLHIVLMLLPLLTLPIGIHSAQEIEDGANPALWLLRVLLTSVGLPFFVVCTSAPLLQKWFASTGHPAARDPYFLYVASNLGSMIALVSYPFLLEPWLPLAGQSKFWTIGYVVLIVLTASCAVMLWKSPPAVVTETLEAKKDEASLKWSNRFHWILLSFAPSSLMLSVTTYLTTDVAAIPLFWVLPLALYLLTFILAFARRQLLPVALLARWMPMVMIVLVLTLLAEATEPAAFLIVLHLVGLFWIALMCHGELSRRRPVARHLTEYYLWLAIGGALGGVFNALAAPMLFHSVAEYPLVLFLACLLRPSPEKEETKITAGKRTVDFLVKDLLPAAILGTLAIGLVFGVRQWGKQADSIGPEADKLRAGMMFVVPTIICYTFLNRPIRFGLGVGALLLAGSFNPGVHGQTEYRERSFFGVHRVTLDPSGQQRILVHGNTIHGRQSLDPELRHKPLTYFHPTGPAGRLFETLGKDPRFKRVAIIGLGTGALACYAKQGQHWTFYEIDPTVLYIARDSGKFTYWKDCPAKLDPVLGDARLKLAKGEERFGMIVIDAFTSDAIPLHLLTREALAVYRSRLTEDGLLLFNVSNRYLNLVPVLANLAADSKPPMTCLVGNDVELVDDEKNEGKSPSIWVVLATNKQDVKRLTASGFWQPRPAQPGVPVWTDDYANLLEVFKWSPSR